MLKITNNASSSQVYLQKQFGVSKEEFAKDCEGAKYTLDGKEELLKFDGKVDDAVIGHMEAPPEIADMKTLARSLDKFTEARPALDKGEMASLDLGQNGGEWTGIKRASHPRAASDFEYVFSNGGPQTVVFTDNNRVKLRTQAENGSIQHEIVGKGFRNEDSNGKYKDDAIFYLSESVKLSNR